MSFIRVKEQSFYGCPGGEVGDGFLKKSEILSFVGVRDPDSYIIGKSLTEPQLRLDGSRLEVDEIYATSSLFINGLNISDYITGSSIQDQNFNSNLRDSRLDISEAFEKDELGDISPSNASLISDSMWILRDDNNLELRANIWRYDTGPEAFTDDISF